MFNENYINDVPLGLEKKTFNSTDIKQCQCLTERYLFLSITHLVQFHIEHTA